MWNPGNLLEFQSCVADLLQSPAVRSMNRVSAHLTTNCLEHSLFVAYVSFLFCRFLHWDFVAAARGGLLHDLFLYNRKLDPYVGKHLLHHPLCALENARRLCHLSERESDIIVKHMWPLTLKLPKYRESFVVSTADKICALAECSPLYRWMHVRAKLRFA